MIIDEAIPSAVTRPQCERLAALAEGKVVLELGSWYGRSTVLLASVAKMLHAVDWHLGDAHAGASDTLAPCAQALRRHKLEGRAVLHVGRNEDVLPMFKDGLFDLVFVDSFHEGGAVQKDVDLVRRLLVPGATWTFHDYGLNFIHNGVPFGVTGVVDRLAKETGRKVELVESLAVLLP
jgi:predicted O-methyltransferase YrrM